MDFKILFLGLAIVIAGVTLLVFLLGLLFTKIANGYVKKHKNCLFKANMETAQKNKALGLKLLNNQSIYNKCVNRLGINRNYECSSSIVSNASNNIIKYLIKYSHIENTEDCLEYIDFCISYLKALKKFHTNMDCLQISVSKQLPMFIRVFATNEQIPYIICDISYELAEIENPKFCFSYISPAGRSERSCSIEITPTVLKKIQSEISKKIEKSEHSKAQRNAMTNDLRNAVKMRDNYTCCLCGNSVYKEPNLLLEVDHIIPISKGGKTEINNLQTLCWRCNRKKHTKIGDYREIDSPKQGQL